MGACTRILDLFKTPNFLLKLLELVLALVCVGLMSGTYFGTETSKLQTVYATLFGFFMLEIVIILGYLLDYPIHRIVVLVICIIATIMYIISGGLLIEVWHSRRYSNVHKNVLGAGITSLFTGIAFGVDASLIFKICRGERTNPFGQP